MKILSREDEVHRLADSPCKRAMEARIRVAHANVGEGIAFDAVADCGGRFFALEEGDDPRALDVGEAETVDVTDFDTRCYEYVELSADGKVFELLHVTNDAGGDSFFVPDESWIGQDFRQALLALAAGRPAVGDDEGRGEFS